LVQTAASSISFQPRNFDFLFQPLQLRVAVDEFGFFSFASAAAKASARLILKRALKSAAVSASARVVEMKTNRQTLQYVLSLMPCCRSIFF
jgi:hypothetical protein